MVEGNLIVGETYFKDYEEFEGIILTNEINHFISSIQIPVGIKFKETSIKLNVENNESDFN